MLDMNVVKEHRSLLVTLLQVHKDGISAWYGWMYCWWSDSARWRFYCWQTQARTGLSVSFKSDDDYVEVVSCRSWLGEMFCWDFNVD